MPRRPQLPKPSRERPALPAALSRRLARSHRRARKGQPWLQGLALALFLPLLALLARVRFRGRGHLPDGGFIVAPNHPSQLDVFFVAAAIQPRRMLFMGKAELWSGRLGGLFNRIGGFPIVRGTWDGEAFATAGAVLERGRVLVMFPEGGVSPVGGYRPAKSGIGHIAHRSGATVVPVHLAGTRGLYRPWTWPRVTVTLGDPIAVEAIAEPTREQQQATADRVLDAIRALAPPTG